MRRLAARRRRRSARLGVQLGILSAAVTALVLAATFVLLTARVRTTTRELIAQQVEQGQRTLQALQRRGDAQFVASAALLAASPSLRSAIGTARLEGLADGDFARTVRRELERMAPDLGRDLVAATDEQGRVFAAFATPDSTGRATDEPEVGADLSALPAVRHALDASLDGGQPGLYLSALRVGDRYFHVAVAPIVLDGYTIGTAMLGDRLDANHLTELQRTFGGELAITTTDQVVAATMPADAVRALQRDTADPRPHAARLAGNEYIVASMPVGLTQVGTAVRLALLQPVTPALRQAMRDVMIEFALWGLLAIAVAAIGAAMLARSVVGPLEAFVQRLRGSVATSDSPSPDALLPDVVFDGKSAIEIRWLHVSFARLMASLSRQRVELEQRGAALASANAVLTAEIRERALAEEALRASEAQLAYQAYHDPLTGLANRARFRLDVDRVLAANVHAHDAVAVLFLDLDHFKTVNDSLGHAVGDQLLVEVAKRLLHATRGCDTVARLGGDEFAVLVDGVRTDNDVLTVVERVMRVMSRPIALEHTEVLVGVSIGVARAAAADRADELLRNADVAMYRAKQRGRGGFELFAPAMHAAVLERLELEADLRHALESPDRELHLVYQPIVALDGGRVAGLEALVRWNHPTRGTITPDQFIPLAETSGMIIPLGRWVLQAACAQAASWVRGAGVDGTDAPYVAVNLSGRQLEDDSLVETVRATIATAGIEPSRILLEMTESVLVQRADSSLRTLHALKALGVRLAIDDFGTGYSSLAYLQRFPVDVLKVDKAFIDGVAEETADAALVRGIVGLADTLGLACVAEGIEHAVQAEQLWSVGCGYGQGFLFAAPLTAREATIYLGARASGAYTVGRRSVSLS